MKETATLTAADVRAASGFCGATLESLTDADWSSRAGSLEWDCRTTVAHIE